ncbi:MAG: 2-C-methyl-D-erythritol 4-phosphate cytidylyltransferase [Actinomycetota bacterium]|nr:2-C-methyl-D-erythritol 4-phosphate cytidylyltransferase [Actinomycetota bacterium]
MTTSCWGVVVAAGRGERFGGDRPKALIELAGRPLVVHAVRALRGGGCARIVVAAPADQVGVVAGLWGEAEVNGAVPPIEADDDVPGLPSAHDVLVVGGGSTRQASVRAALAVVPDDARWVLIHDAARPLMSASVVAAVVATLEAGAPAVIPVLPVIDTIKSVNAAGEITATVDRYGLYRAQTPQGFERALLVRALDQAVRRAKAVTDDAAAVAALGVLVTTVPGDERGMKITTPADLITAEALLAAAEFRR